MRIVLMIVARVATIIVAIAGGGVSRLEALVRLDQAIAAADGADCIYEIPLGLSAQAMAPVGVPCGAAVTAASIHAVWGGIDFALIRASASKA
jgi:hypothetical protein